LKIYISQGIVATHLRCGGIFSNRVIANCTQNVQ